MRFLLLLIPCFCITAHAADLTPDPAVTWGAFENGMRYGVMANHQPKDKVTIRLQVQCGSLQESDPQRGLAHFLEHMAFNGTTNYPPGTLVERLQHLGLAFGAHTNAHTSFDETVYKLDLPDAAPATIATGLGVMADWAGGMLLETKEIDRERGVILSELRDRDGASLRLWRAQSQANYAGMIIADRLPIGISETISAADRQLIASYYAAFYRPERMVIVVVGAIDPTAVIAQLRTSLGAVKANGPAIATPSLGTLTLNDKPVVTIRTDAEADNTEIELVRVMNEARPVDGVAHRRDELLRAVAEGILARRISALVAKDPNCPVQGGGAFSYHWQGLAHAGVQGTSKPGQALAAMQVLVREYRRMQQYGPTPSELAIEIKATAAQLDTAVAQAATRTNPQLAQILYTSAFHGDTVQSPAQDRDLHAPILAKITVADIVESLRAYRARPGRDSLTILGREDLGAGADERVAQALTQAWDEAPSKPVDQALAPWGYATQPEQALLANGTWATDDVPANGITAKSRTGLRIQTKATTFQPNQILIQLRFEVPCAGRPVGVAELIGRGFFASGLGKHSADDEATLFADSSVKLLGIGVSDDAVTMAAACTPADYQRCLERLAAHIVDPGWRPEVEQRILQAWSEELKAAALDVDAVTERALATTLIANDPARRAATDTEVHSLTFAQARAWLDPVLKTAPLTVTIVGDLAQAKGDPAAVFANLPRKGFAPAATDIAAARATLIPAIEVKPGEQRVSVAATVPKALVRIAWPGDDIYDISQTRRMNLLAQCFGERLRIRIREELGAAYSPGAWYAASDSQRGFGWINVSIGLSPEKVDQVVSATRALADDLAAKGIDDALLDQVKTPMVKGLAARLQRNDWWLNTVMARLATQPFRLEWARSMQTDIAAVTPAELSVLAKRYFINAKAVTVIGSTPAIVP